jgi:2-keto-3-deoxy-6-phosphogluconate aldolase
MKNFLTKIRGWKSAGGVVALVIGGELHRRGMVADPTWDLLKPAIEAFTGVSILMKMNRMTKT